MNSNLSRSIPHKPILFIDFDQTMTNGDDLTKSLLNAIYCIEFERGVDQSKAKSIGLQTRKEGKYGIYNFILALCNNKLNDFQIFCQELFKRIDYSSIRKDEKLMNIMKEASKKFDLYILTNNHRTHVDLGLKKLFGVGIDEVDFIRSFDILETYHDGQFWPKQTPGAYEMACSRVGAKVSECTLIDDLVNNVKMARSIGMRTCLVKHENLFQILTRLINEKKEK